MFICESCKRVTNPKEPQSKIATETRKKIYELGFDESGLAKTSFGIETVKEISVCPDCKPKEEPIDQRSISSTPTIP